ncbi:MAG TPA: helix-turn-helix domain-containing protein [Anaerolineales bacterium]|nr:helix-turn-helix domain-containing protein [Anaerolineales bacterium]
MAAVEYSFGNWIKHRRKALDLTQHELATRVGCSVSLIFKIEADERRPSRQIAELLAEKLDIPGDQRTLFLKIARQEKSIAHLDEIPSLSRIESVSPPQLNSGNLPIPPTPLVGREHEIRVITEQLLEPACRLLTLIGPGGIGKTRLAIEAGSQSESHFADGVYFISLSGVGMTESIIPAIADTLGLAFSGPAEPVVQVTNFLRTQKILLVIDSMEHLLEGGSLLGEILRQTRQIKILVTSREPLRLQWEWLFEVRGLPILEEIDTNFERNSAIMLFVQRARQVSQNFSLDSDDMEALVRICKLVGGLPLAIELAASWARILSCREIALELERDLDILETKKLDVPQRHRSIKNVFDHSWTLLSNEERTLLMRLSVFQGGFSREAAISVTCASLPTLSALVDKSLLRHSKTPDRYALHELIRQYAVAKVKSDPAEEARASENYAVYYANWVTALEASLKSAQQSQTSQLISSETSNWLASWHWAVKYQQLDILRKMSPCLNWYFEVHGYYDEALSTFKTALNAFRATGVPDSLKSAEEKSAFASLVDQVGWFEFRKGNVERATALFAESLEIAREYENPEVLYYIYEHWGYLSLMQGDALEADRLTTECLNYAKVLSSPWHIAFSINMLGIVAYQQGNLNKAYQELTESLKIWRSIGDPRGLVFCMLYLGMTALALKDNSMARSILEEGNAIAKANMDRWAEAFGLDVLGVVCLAQRQNEEALVHFRKSIELSKEIGDQLNATKTIVRMGQAYAALRSKEDAKRLFLEAYTNAQQAKWTVILLNALVSFAEVEDGLSAETKLAVALSVLSHPAVTPNIRARSERIRNEITQCLTAGQIEIAENRAKEKMAEVLAQEILQ